MTETTEREPYFSKRHERTAEMNKTEIIRKLNELEFDKEDYWLITGGAMVIRGIREETHDIDLGCTGKLADALEAKGYPVQHTADGKRKFVISPDVEIFEEWLYFHQGPDGNERIAGAGKR